MSLKRLTSAVVFKFQVFQRFRCPWSISFLFLAKFFCLLSSLSSPTVKFVTVSELARSRGRKYRGTDAKQRSERAKLLGRNIYSFLARNLEVRPCSKVRLFSQEAFRPSNNSRKTSELPPNGRDRALENPWNRPRVGER